MKNLKKKNKIIINIIIFSMFFIIADFVIANFAIKFVPVHNFIKFHEVVKIEELESDKGLRFYSTYEVKRDSDIHYENILYCNNVAISNTNWLAKNQKKGEVIKKEWLYQGVIEGGIGKECFMKSIISVKLKYVNDKSLEINSNKFKIK